MQVSELTDEDVVKFKDLFEEIKLSNPKAIMRCFSGDKFQKKDCLFKEKCRPRGMR